MTCMYICSILKLLILTSLDEILVLLTKSSQDFSNVLVTYLFTDLLECCLNSEIQSTDWQLAKILVCMCTRDANSPDVSR